MWCREADMRAFSHLAFALFWFLGASVAGSMGQLADGVRGHVFRSNTIGMTYTFPDGFTPKTEAEQIVPPDPTGREHMILALWDNQGRQGVPKMAFLYDRKQRPASFSSAEIATRYLHAVRELWGGIPGIKFVGPTKLSFAGYGIWRLDWWTPEQQPRFNAAAVIPLPDRRILAIKLTASSQRELDREIDSLAMLRFDKHAPAAP